MDIRQRFNNGIKKIIKKSKCIKNKIAFTFWVSDTHFYVDEALYLKKKINEISFTSEYIFFKILYIFLLYIYIF